LLVSTSLHSEEHISHEKIEQLKSFDVPAPPQPGDLYWYEGFAEQKIYRFRDECFPALRNFNDDVQKCLSRYHGLQLAIVVESLSLQQNLVFTSWIERRHPENPLERRMFRQSQVGLDHSPRARSDWSRS
jgi:hypothetical protein